MILLISRIFPTLCQWFIMRGKQNNTHYNLLRFWSDRHASQILALSIFIHFHNINGLSRYELGTGMISQKLDPSSINSLKMFLDFRALTREVITEIANWKERECYIALQGASTRSSTVLVSNQGYSFGVKRKNDATDTIYWRCNKRPKKKHCSATVITKNWSGGWRGKLINK